MLIEVRAFGLNRSEWFTRIGESPTVQLPRVLGIECVGTVVRAPGGELEEGQRVAAMMGGMGREEAAHRPSGLRRSPWPRQRAFA